MDKQGKHHYVFLEEQLKKKPFYKRKWFRRAVRMIGSGVLFGTAAGIMFSAVSPMAREEIAALVRFVRADKDTDVPMTSEIPTENVQTEESTEDNIPGKWTMDVYRTSYKGMAEVARNAERFIAYVDVRGEDLIGEVYEDRMQSAGIILGYDEESVYILVSLSEENGEKPLVIRFSDGILREGSLYRRDGTTSLSVIKVAVKDLEEGVLDTIRWADFLTGRGVEKGEPVIAVGSPQGYSEAMGTGIITSVIEDSVTDDEYTIMTTDISGSADGTGVLLTLGGQIAGLIVPGFVPKQAQISVTALDVGKLNYLVKQLCEGTDRPYLGICGTEITEMMASSLEMPRGIYIKEVEAGSPALLEGIRAGDVITHIDGETVSMMDEFRSALNEKEPEEEMKITVSRQIAQGYGEKKITVKLGSRRDR